MAAAAQKRKIDALEKEVGTLNGKLEAALKEKNELEDELAAKAKVNQSKNSLRDNVQRKLVHQVEQMTEGAHIVKGMHRIDVLPKIPCGTAGNSYTPQKGCGYRTKNPETGKHKRCGRSVSKFCTGCPGLFLCKEHQLYHVVDKLSEKYAETMLMFGRLDDEGKRDGEKGDDNEDDEDDDNDGDEDDEDEE